MADYVLHHDVILPDEWYAYIVRNNFMVSEEIKSKHEDVDWETEKELQISSIGAINFISSFTQ